MAPSVPSSENAANGTNGTNSATAHPQSGPPGYSAIQSTHNPHPHHRSPYQPVGDFLSNVSRFKIIESTLREGEQFAKYVCLSTVLANLIITTHSAYFDLDAKIKIAKALDQFGVDCTRLALSFHYALLIAQTSNLRAPLPVSNRAGIVKPSAIWA